MKAMHKRLSVPLTEQDLADIALLRQSPSAARAAGLEHPPGGSDASVVHALLRERLDRVAQHVADSGYEQLSRDEEWLEHAAAVRARRRGGAD